MGGKLDRLISRLENDLSPEIGVLEFAQIDYRRTCSLAPTEFELDVDIRKMFADAMVCDILREEDRKIAKCIGAMSPKMRAWRNERSSI